MAVAALAGCGSVSSAPSRPQYGREGPAIALAREGAEENDRKKAAEARQQAEAERQKEVDRRVAERVALATQPAAAVPPPPPAPAAAAGQVKHVVVLWLKKPGDPAGRAAIVGARDLMRTIPGVLDVSAGEAMKSDRKVVDSTYDVAVVITFKDEQAMRDYNTHPTHLKLVEEVLKPNVERYVVYDFGVK